MLHLVCLALTFVQCPQPGHLRERRACGGEGQEERTLSNIVNLDRRTNSQSKFNHYSEPVTDKLLDIAPLREPMFPDKLALTMTWWSKGRTEPSQS